MLVDHRCHEAGACPGLNVRVEAILNPNSSSCYSTFPSNVRSACFLLSIEQLLSDIKSISLINPARLVKHTRRPQNFSECKAIDLTLRSSLRFLVQGTKQRRVCELSLLFVGVPTHHLQIAYYGLRNVRRS